MKCPRCGGTGEVNEDWITFGGRVLARRRKLRLLQKELAQRAGITQAMVSRIESGTALPNIEKARAIAEVLESTPAKLVYPKEKSP